MNVGLIIGKKKSTGTPGKNTKIILGRPAVTYAYIAAAYSKIDRIYVSTDSDEIAEIGKNYGAIHIPRPPELATPESLTEDVLLHAWDIIKRDNAQKNITSISLLIANNPAIDVNLLNHAIDFINSTSEWDSCFSVARYDMFSPSRARKIMPDGEIKSFIDLSLLGNVSSLRDSQGPVYYCDFSIQVMKPHCLERIDEGQLPFKWQGKRSKAVITDFGFDIDAEWQVVVIEYWLKLHGFTESTIPWKKE